MKRRTRRILFWFAVLIFGGGSFFAIRYAQGYKYDWNAGRFVRTGAVVVVANDDAKLFVDDRLVGPLSFLGHRAGRDRLLPGTYTVRLVRDGWSQWQKAAQITEGLVTEFPEVLLLPTDDDALAELRKEASASLDAALTLADAPAASSSPVPRRGSPTPVPRVAVDGFTLVGSTLIRDDGTASGSLVAEGVLGFSVGEKRDRVLWWTRNEAWVFWTADTGYQPFRTAGERQSLGRWTSGVRGAAWFRGSDHAVVDLGVQGYRVVELDQRGGANIIRF